MGLEAQATDRRPKFHIQHVISANHADPPQVAASPGRKVFSLDLSWPFQPPCNHTILFHDRALTM
jgi:hypothetical protein